MVWMERMEGIVEGIYRENKMEAEGGKRVGLKKKEML